MFFCPKIQVPICIGWASILLFLILFCIPLGGIGILPSTEQISCRFCCSNNFFLINQYSWFDIVMFLQKNAGPDFYRLGEILIAVVLLLHLLGLHTYLADSRTNLLQVLLLIYFFFDQSVLLIYCCCVSAEKYRCRNLMVGWVLWYFWVMFTFD